MSVMAPRLLLRSESRRRRPQPLTLLPAMMLLLLTLLLFIASPALVVVVSAAGNTVLWTISPTLTPITGNQNVTISGRFPAAVVGGSGVRLTLMWTGAPLFDAGGGTGSGSGENITTIQVTTIPELTTPTSVGVSTPVAQRPGGVLIRYFDPSAPPSSSSERVSASFVSLTYYDPASISWVDTYPNQIQVLGFTRLTVSILGGMSATGAMSVTQSYMVQFCSSGECITTPVDVPVMADSYYGTVLQFFTPIFVGSQHVFTQSGQPVRPRVFMSLSVNGGVNWHATNASLVLLPPDPLRVGLMYSFKIFKDQWVTSHNHARGNLESYLQSRMIDRYEEDSFVDPTTGAQRDEIIMEKLILPTAQGGSFGAQYMIVTGTEYTPTAVKLATKYAGTGVNMILFSSLRTVLPLSRPNMAFATGRMYEAMYLAGIAAGAVTRSGVVGCVMLKPHPTVRAMCNAFALGVQRSGAVNVRILVWNIDTFQDPWVEQNVGLDMVARGVDVLVATSNGNEAPTVVVQAGGFAVGFNNDLRERLNDNVICSVLYEWTASYKEFANRILLNQTFGPATLEST